MTHWDRYKPDPEVMEAAAFSSLEIGQFEGAAEVFDSIVRLKDKEVPVDNGEGMSTVQQRAIDLLDLLHRRDEVNALLQSTRKAKLANYGIGSV